MRTIAYSGTARGAAAIHSQIGLARLIGALLILATFLVAQSAHARPIPQSFADLVDELTPAVVNISTSQRAQGADVPEMMPQLPPGSPFEDLFRDFFDRQQRGDQGRPRRVTSLGSGFIIDPAGYVVTNNHVIKEADEVTVVLNDDREFPATVVGFDAKTDLALLKVETDEPLPAVEFGDSDALRVGDWVLAIGNPFGLGNSVTAGIVSARSRDINAGPYDDFLQTDAPINRGNSGGPLFDMDGKVIGINTAIFSPSGGSVGIGFAVPAALAQPVISQLREYGRTRRGWLGVRIQSVTEEIAESLGLDAAKGALVADVTPDSPAAAAGIESGDVILEFDGKEVPAMRDLPRIVASTTIGKAVDVVVSRKGKPVNVEVTIGELEESPMVLATATQSKEETESAEAETLGITFAQISPELRERFNLEQDDAGVVVTDVKPDSVAADRNVQPGDVVVQVNIEEVKSPTDVVAQVEKAETEERKSVLFLLKRGADQHYVAVKLGEG